MSTNHIKTSKKRNTMSLKQMVAKDGIDQVYTEALLFLASQRKRPVKANTFIRYAGGYKPTSGKMPVWLRLFVYTRNQLMPQ